MIVVLLLCGALYLGVSTARYMKETIRAQFNQQQLVLARTTALMIEGSIRNAMSDLVLLHTFPAVQSRGAEGSRELFFSVLPVLQRGNIVEIARVDRDGNSLFVVNERGMSVIPSGLNRAEAGDCLAWAADPMNRNKVTGTAVRPKDATGGKESAVMDLVAPTYEDSSNSFDRRQSGRFSGYLRISLDISRLLEQILQPVTSGKTGYAWVIDSSGNFLYHPESSVIGENAFTIRHSRHPDVSLTQINEIQRKEMLEGKEGTGIYIAGWHRERVEPIEKIISYTPVRIRGPHMTYTWSVAVVTPVHEIEGIVNAVYEKQILLQCVVLSIILLGTVVVVLYEFRWSSVLEREVAAKTEDIRRYAGELEQSEAKYRSLVESAEDLIFTVDRQGTIGMANEHMRMLFDLDGDKLVGRNLYGFLPGEKADAQMELIRRAAESQTGVWAEVPLDVRDEDRWFNIRYIPIREGEKGRGLVLGIARDITDRKKLEVQLMNREKQASLGTLAAGVAHEINNPLGVILGFCDLLLERMEPGTTEYDDLKTIEKHGLHCQRIVQGLLDFVQGTGDEEEGCEVNTVVNSVLAPLKSSLKESGIRLIVSLAEGLPNARGNRDGLKQAFGNLLRNAVQAMNGQGVLTVVTRPGTEAGWLEIVISDNGRGIRQEYRPRIFDPFYTTREVGGGMGLGLSAAYGIISKCGGTISCESHTAEERPGSPGTSFTILLPVTATLVIRNGTVDGPQASDSIVCKPGRSCRGNRKPPF